MNTKTIKKIWFSTKLFLLQHKGYRDISKYVKARVNLNKAIKQYEDDGSKLPIKDGINIWKKSFKKFILAQPTESEISTIFFQAKIKLLKSIELEDRQPILICVVKDDLYRINKMYEHYKKLGVKHFAIIDNGSTDGTLEFLLEKKEIEVFFIGTPYSSLNREAWVNRIIAYYGIGKWYLNVDSDELLVYNDDNIHDLNNLINYYELNEIRRVRALMVDMYSNKGLFEEIEGSDDYENNRYFDTDSYHKINLDILDLIVGGPRGRVFGQPAWLTKYPLFKFVEGDIQGKSHFQFPFNVNKNTNCNIALLHYKFLSGDFNKYKKIADEGRYHNGSVQYKKYVEVYEKNNSVSFMYDKSKEFKDSNSIYAIDMMKKIDWDGCEDNAFNQRE